MGVSCHENLEDYNFKSDCIQQESTSKPKHISYGGETTHNIFREYRGEKLVRLASTANDPPATLY